MDFYQLMNQLKDTLEDRGYDSYEVHGILVKPDGTFKVNYEAIDYFQADLDYSDRFESGYGRYFGFQDMSEFLSKLHEIPSRETREFQVLLRRTAGLKLLSDAMVGAAGSSFAAELSATLEKYKLLESE